MIKLFNRRMRAYKAKLLGLTLDHHGKEISPIIGRMQVSTVVEYQACEICLTETGRLWLTP